MAAGWSSLPGDLANLVADRLLATNDLDSYMDFRAVCHGWRASTADPKSSPPGDPRFQPRQWLMLDDGDHGFDSDDEDEEELHQSDAGERLFVNAATGRFVRRNLQPALGGSYFLVAAGGGGGWLVLAERIPPHAARLRNPFTGALIQFAAPVPPELKMKVAAHVIGSSPTLILLRYDFAADTTIYWADPSNESFVAYKEEYCDLRLAKQSLTSHSRKIMGLVKTRPPFIGNYFSQYSRRMGWDKSFLVESAGEMLIVFILPWGGMKVFMEAFKMAATGSNDNELERVRNIGNRALFVGACRSLSVDADKFASVEANCIYYTHGSALSSSSYHVCSLAEETSTRVGSGREYGPKDCVSVVELLCRYTSGAERSELGLELELLRHREFAALDMEMTEADRRWRRRLSLNRATGGYITYDYESDD
ncbi:unnamed protein product [Urochloa decumbens]|uniref:KIB1-4 beta-propeller domain-containing protein n=1 Tax=Urochloa decumbens TaxID=240449 RepID=A0ABC9A5L6_9POAL